jgi:hypothetical protein
MKPILVLDLTKLTAYEVAGLRRDGFDVPPNIAGYKRYNVVMPWQSLMWPPDRFCGDEYRGLLTS